LSASRLSNSFIQEMIEIAQDASVGIGNVDFQIKRRYLEMLKVRIEVEKKRFTIHSLAGQITGEIRTLPKVSDSGVVTGLQSPSRIL